MGQQLRDSLAPHNNAMVDPVLIGQLIEAVKNNTKTTESLCKQVSELRQEQSEARSMFEHTNRDIMEIRECMAAIPSERQVRDIAHEVVKEQLHSPEDPDIREDMLFLRRSRKRHENVSSIKLYVTRAVILAVVLGALTWTGNAVYDKIKEDVKQEQHP